MTATATLTAADLNVGDTVAWATWTGEEATATIATIDRFRITTNKADIYWEATCHTTLDGSLARTRGLRIAEAAR